MTDQMITALGRGRLGDAWLMTIIYASPKPLLREELWNDLRKLGGIVNIPWVLLGEMNQPLDQGDKMGGRPVNQMNARMLRETIDACKFIDLGFHGLRFTWTNGRKG